MHPELTDLHKITRIKWTLDHLQGKELLQKSSYMPMFDYVHLDEKWFYLSKKSHRVYLAQEEKGKYKAACSSKWILKVMFTTALARISFTSEGVCIFDGKIGIFPFTYQEPARRSSKNKERGAIVTKLIERVTPQVTRRMLIDEIILAIKAKSPQDGQEKIIFLQQDNARAHVSQSDAEWQLGHKQDGFTFILINQPTNSPDLNILDLGFFRSIQSLMHKKMPKDVDDMLMTVHEAFFELDPTTLSNVWYSLQFVMNEILKCKGGNEFDIPHHNKRRLQAQDILPISIIATQRDIIQSWNHVYKQENIEGAACPSQVHMDSNLQDLEDNHDF